jgi:hypothetical protein
LSSLTDKDDKMKKILLFILIAVGSAVYAQEQTLMGQEEISNGGFGAPVIKFTSINSQFGVLVGGKGGWIIDHSIVLGAAGYGLVNNVEGTLVSSGDKMLLNFGYGGFDMGYIISSDKIVHMSVNVLIGGGVVSHRVDYNVLDWNWSISDLGTINTNKFFVAEPEVNVELNLVKFFRIDIGASYRFISGINRNGLTNSDLSGPSAIMTLKFGKF